MKKLILTLLFLFIATTCYGAVTVTFPDGGVYHTVNLAGSGDITEATIYSDLFTLAGGAETYMTRTGAPGSYVYTIKLQAGENYVRLIVRTGVNYVCEAGATMGFEWSATSTTYGILYFQSNSTLTLAENHTFDGNANSATYARGYIYGDGTMIGVQTSGNEAIFENFRSFYVRMYDTTPWNLDYVIFRNPTYAGGYMWYCVPAVTQAYDGSGVAHSLKHITFSDIQGWGIVYNYRGSFASWIIEDWTIDNIEEVQFYHVQTLRMVRLIIKDTDDYTRHYDNGALPTDSKYHTSKTKDWAQQTFNQPMIVFDTPTFDNCDSGAYNFLTYNGGVYLIKNGTTMNASRGYYAYDATILLYGTQTYTNITTERTWAGSGTFLHVRKLDLTVYQPDGVTPLENACVNIRTKLVKTVGARDYPYEQYSFLTDENGQVKGVADDSIYLTEKEETSTGVYTQWSDGTGNQVHVLTISHPDYAVHTEEIAFTEDKTMTVTMSLESTTIYDSTLYDTILY